MKTLVDPTPIIFKLKKSILTTALQFMWARHARSWLDAHLIELGPHHYCLRWNHKKHNTYVFISSE